MVGSRMGDNGIDSEPESPYLKKETEANDRCLG